MCSKAGDTDSANYLDEVIFGGNRRSKDRESQLHVKVKSQQKLGVVDVHVTRIIYCLAENIWQVCQIFLVCFARAVVNLEKCPAV